MRFNLTCVLAMLPLELCAATSQRCDLVSRPDTAKCLDLSKLQGATLRVPANTTRIPTNGLTLCGIPGSVPPPVDIVYAVDQTASMVPTAIFASSEDTTGWYECNDVKSRPVIDFLGSSIDFHGNIVEVIDPSTSIDDLRSVCKVAGDPYNARVTAIQSAIRSQAAASPLSMAATINFGPGIQSSQPITALSSQIGVNTLLSSLKLEALSGTNYEAALTWSRIQLYGGKSRRRTIASSIHPVKAIIILSDGRPSKGTWQNFLDPTTSIDIGDTTWTTVSDSVPPVYGIFMGVDGVEGSTLQKISDTTGGTYYQIPPNMPDSLALVIRRILGSLIKSAKPDTLKISNQTNGQSSIATTSSANGNAYRMFLDSLVALEPGANNLSLTLDMGGKTLKSNWTILVADTSTSLPSSVLDPYLTPRCGPASSLTLHPDKSGLAWADMADRNLVATLTTHPDGNKTLPIAFQTKMSSDLEDIALKIPYATHPDSFASFVGSIPWQDLSWSNSIPGDLVLRSGPAWDTAMARFTMPRDRRDTAVARIALHHQAMAELILTPEVDGPSGKIEVQLTDPNISTASVRVSIHHHFGDSLSVKLQRGTDGVYRGYFQFQQGATPNVADTTLEMGTASPSLDSVSGNYQNLSSWARVRPAIFRLRFLDAAGIAHDSLSVAMALGDSSHVTLETWLGSTPCTSCAGKVTAAPSDPAIQILSAGKRTSSFQIVSGRAMVTVKATAPVLSGGILFTHDSLGASATVYPVQISPVAPDSVVYLDADGDGALDRTVIFCRSPWTGATELVLPWPDSIRRLDWRSSNMSLSTDSLTATFNYPPQSPDTTTAQGPLVARWKWNADWPWKNVAIIEHIAPVPLRATLSRGRILDTLRVPPSEKLWPSLTPIDQLVAKIAGTNSQNLSPRQVSLETATGALILLFPSDSSFLQVNPGDSVRFLSSVKDLSGNKPGATAKWVVVEGTDPLPRDAVLMDTDADGRADRVVVRLAAPLAVTDKMGFRWPDTSGIIQERWLPVSEATPDSGNRILTFDIDPFPFAATSCPASGCANLGWMATSRFGAEVRSSFAVRDGVDPIPLLANYRFSTDGWTSDTLIVRFSEPLHTASNGAWISLGRASSNPIGTAFLPMVKPVWISSTEARFLVDSTFPAKADDSLRIAFGGALADTSWNAPDSLAWWTSIAWGQPPPVLKLNLPHQVVRAQVGDVPALEPALTIVVRDPASTGWSAPHAQLPDGLANRFGGPVIRLNRIPQNLGLYIYDNLGVAVLNRDLSDLARLESEGFLQRTRRGDYEVWLAWNGKDAAGLPVSSGVYTFRICGQFRDGKDLLIVNTTIKEGIFRTADY